MSNDAVNLMVYDANKKSTGVAYLLFFFLGGLGIHRFYAGYKGTGAAILVLTLLWIPTAGITAIVAGIWLLVDLFLIPSLVRKKNAALIQSLV
jgi:TM2 domain-containing membrane protein YozV